MKIFNVKPIKVNEYTFNRDLLSESEKGSSYQSSFDYEFSVDLPETFIIIFDLKYTVGNSFNEINSALKVRNEFSVEIQAECADEEIILSYNYSCQFNFKNEGLEADIQSLSHFLTGFYAHITSILQQQGLEKIMAREVETRKRLPLKDTALEIIDNLSANKMYEF